MDRAVPLSCDADGLVREKPAPAVDAFNARLLQKIEMQVIEPIHLGPHPAKQFRNAAFNRTNRQAIGRRILQLMPCLGAVDQQFFRDTSPDHTGAADAVTLHNRHPGPVLGCPLGCGQTARPSTKNKQIKR